MADLRPDRLAAQLASEPLRPAYLIAGPEPLLVLEAADAVRAAAREQGVGDREVYDIEGARPGLGQRGRRVPGAGLVRHAARGRNPHAERQAGQGRRRNAHAIRREPAARRRAAGHRRRMEQAARRQVERGARAHRPSLVAWQVQAARTRRMDRSAHARARACAPIATRCRRWPIASKATCSRPRRKSTSSRCSAEGRTLDAATMESLVSDSARYDVFRLVDAAMNGQPAQVSRMLHGLRGEGEAVPALLGMVAMELQRAAALARVAARGGNLQAEFKAQRIWDSKQAAYTRALKRHDAAKLGTLRRRSRTRGPHREGPPAMGPRSHRCVARARTRAARRRRSARAAAAGLTRDAARPLLRRHLRSRAHRPPRHRARGARCACMPTCTCCPPPIRRTRDRRTPTPSNARTCSNSRSQAKRACIVDRRELRRAGPSYTVDTLARTARRIRPACAAGVDGRRRFGVRAATRGIAGANCSTSAHLLAIDRPGAPDRPGRAGRARARGPRRTRAALVPARATACAAGGRVRRIPPGRPSGRSRRPSSAAGSPPATRAGATGCRRRSPHSSTNRAFMDAQSRDADGFTPAGRERLV